MKIVVTDMPNNIYDCPYFVDNSCMDYTDFGCTYNKCARGNSKCNCTLEDNPKYKCKYFIDLSYAISSINQSFVEH